MAFDLDMISIGCVAPMDPVMKFSTRVSGLIVGRDAAFRTKRGFVMDRSLHTFRVQKS